MLELLFVSSSHPLSPYIYSLDHHCKQLSDKERAEFKEEIDPKARFVSSQQIILCGPLFRCPFSIHISPTCVTHLEEHK